ncbi:hypothetical protein KDW_53590 [Dictyobacter vulcani]|uniref:Cardiolipin synthase N-terminal domain-containing protein n=1 Tax=Dictyobacter vulcani TaxID=2607529 RepID=A0A5J4KXD4_9CHLR|nr:PLD nuclease N-terminal domain-containing protein [Dictyobacter vulcani]GER91197.1 hypothetical protein KDW_53590 [Dictyobacter vulcani]
MLSGHALFIIIPLAIWIIALIHCSKNRALSGTARLFWAIFIFVTNFFGAIMYFIFAPKRLRSRARTAYYQPSKQQRQQQQYYQPSRPPQEPYYRPAERAAAEPEPYRPYGQGYATQKQEQPVERAPMQAPAYNPYEYPQATYPEQTQQQSQ